MEYTVIRTPEQVIPYLKKLKEAKVLAVDTETTGLDAHKNRLRLVQIGAEGMPVLLIDCFSFLKDSRGTECLREILEGEAGKIFHNAKFDLQFLRKEGILPENILDTMLAAELLRPCGGPRKVSLAAVSSHYLGTELDKTERSLNRYPAGICSPGFPYFAAALEMSEGTAKRERAGEDR